MGTSNSQSDGKIGRYADIMLDQWFKRSFKEYGNAKRLMQLFLEALIPERKIASLEYTSEESTNQNPGAKSIRVDVECVDDKGHRFVVEVQRAEQESFYDRAVFNSTFAVQRQLLRGTTIYKFNPVYFIGITRFPLHPDTDQYLYRYSIREEHANRVMTKDLSYTFLDVSKCKDHKGASFVEKIGYALEHMSSFDERPSGFAGEFFDLLFNSADIANFALEDKIKYINDMTTERDIKNQIAFAEEKGIEKGREEGRAKLLAAATHLKAKGIPLDVISDATGLSLEQLEAL